MTTFNLGVLGPAMTFSDLAASRFISNKVTNDGDKKLYHSIADIFADLKKNKIDSAIVPIENNTYGTVRETIDNLFIYDFEILYEFSLPVHHHLVAKKGTRIGSVKRIYSHQQALSQCSAYLRKNFPKSQQVSHSSTASSIQKLLRSKSGEIAVICSKKAAKEYKLNILAEYIEDQKQNRTKFVVIGNRKNDKLELKASKSKKYKTSIAFHFKKDSPGTLFTVFKGFNDAKINMTKIESRPTVPKWGDYIFFMDFEGKLTDKKIAKVLGSIGKKVAMLKTFGSYISDKITL